MNINGLSTTNALSEIKISTTVDIVTSKGSSFTTLLSGLKESESLAVTNSDDKKTSVVLRSFEDKDHNRIGHTDDHEHKFCSLCGAEIEADGSCPNCIIPWFVCGSCLSGNHAVQDDIHSQAVSQAQGVTQENGGSLSLSKSEN